MHRFKNLFKENKKFFKELAFLISICCSWVNCNRIMFFRSSDLGQLAMSIISTFLESFPLSMQIRTVIHIRFINMFVLRELILYSFL